MLRRKLSAAESEGDIRAQELETDFNELEKKMLAQVSVVYDLMVNADSVICRRMRLRNCFAHRL